MEKFNLWGINRSISGEVMAKRKGDLENAAPEEDTGEIPAVQEVSEAATEGVDLPRWTVSVNGQSSVVRAADVAGAIAAYQSEHGIWSLPEAPVVTRIETEQV